MSQPSHEFTVEQIEGAIAAALEEHDFKMVVALIKVLAIQAPDHAQVILDSVQLGMNMARLQQGGT